MILFSNLAKEISIPSSIKTKLKIQTDSLLQEKRARGFFVLVAAETGRSQTEKSILSRGCGFEQINYLIGIFTGLTPRKSAFPRQASIVAFATSEEL